MVNGAYAKYSLGKHTKRTKEIKILILKFSCFHFNFKIYYLIIL